MPGKSIGPSVHAFTDSTFGIRLYTPNGTPGVNGTNDWEEDFHTLALQVSLICHKWSDLAELTIHTQRGRWYPTTAMLPNGSILVVGGEIGSNDKPQPNLEILPTPVGGDTVLDLPWLARTDPWNLYPYIVVLPSGRIFIGTSLVLSIDPPLTGRSLL